MATLPLRISWCRLPVAVAAPASRNNARPTCFCSCPSPVPVRIQHVSPRHNAFRSNCHRQKDAMNQHPEPEPERDDVNNPEVAASSTTNGGSTVFARKLHEFGEAIRAAMATRDAPDMFPKEKDQISNYIVKISSSRANEFQNLNNKVMALTFCSEAQTALDLASRVMDIVNIEALGLKTEISRHTTHWTVKKYARVFCDVAEDVYHKRIKVDTILSFLDALRGLGAVLHIVVQDTIAMMDYSLSKKTIIYYGASKKTLADCAEAYTVEFDKTMHNLKDEFTMATDIEHSIVMGILFDGMKHTQSYVAQLIECRREALLPFVLNPSI